MDLPTPLSLGQAVRGRRTDLGLSQLQLAEAIGVSRQWIIDVEAGKATVGIGLVLRLLEGLGLGLTVVERHTIDDLADAPPVGAAIDLDEVLRSYRR